MTKKLHVWQPAGQDVAKDALYGRLGFSGDYGRTVVAGATNAVATRQESDRVSFYVGTVNGGIFSKVFKRGDEQEDQSQWHWISNPSGGYDGSQSIGKLALSENGKYLAVGQGNPSNYKAVSGESYGLILGRLKKSGMVDWLDMDKKYRKKLLDHNIRSLQWVDNRTIVATTFDPYSSVSPGSIIVASLDKQGGVENVRIKNIDRRNLVSGSQANFSIFAGYGLKDDGTSLNQINLVSNRALRDQEKKIRGSKLKGMYSELMRSYSNDNAVIRRVALAPGLVDKHLIAYVGLSKKVEQSDDNYIYRIDRLQVNPQTLFVKDVETFQADSGEIGAGQAGTDRHYGNFSFAIDPRSPDARGVFVGGNHFMYSKKARGIAPTGGLVYVDFLPDTPAITHRLYGPRVELLANGNEELVWPVDPGSPHADSRDIGFVSTDQGPVLIQVDDGGVWRLDLQKKAGSGVKSDQYWQPLNAPGLNAFEVMMTDWHSQSDGLLSSYQDNAASYGISGESHVYNMWQGDGEIAIIDDANDLNPANAYLSSQQYIAYGSIARLKISGGGFIESFDNVDFLLRDAPGSKPVLWDQTTEALLGQQEYVPFILPFEINPYRENSIVMAGRRNIYEAASVDPADYPNSIVFRSLLTPRSGLSVQSLDNHGDNSGDRQQSIYAGIYVNGHAQILGRHSSDDSYFMGRTIYDGSKDSREDLAHGMIVDLAHRPSGDGLDDVYWLQGGEGVIHSAGLNDKTFPQVLRIRLSDGGYKTYGLSELGIELNDSDKYQLQSIVFVPGRKNRADSLVVSGLAGHWISALDDQGLPIGFEPMQWIDPYKPEAPNVYPTSVKYEPKDDLLIAGTLGKGSWIYRFSKDKVSRPDPEGLLHSSDVNFTQFMEFDLNKRQHQKKSNFVVQLDRRELADPDQDIPVNLILKDLDQWREYIQYVSPLFFYQEVVSNEKALAKMNMLEKSGIKAFDGKVVNGNNLSVPLFFGNGNSTIGLTFTPEVFQVPEDDVVLRYKVKRPGTDEVTSSKITLARPSLDASEFEIHGEILEEVMQTDSAPRPLSRSMEINDLNHYPEMSIINSTISDWC